MQELTVPANMAQSMVNARNRKQSKQAYVSLVNAVMTAGYNVDYDTIEIGSLGYFNQESINAIHSAVLSVKRSTIKKDLLSTSKVAVACSRQDLHEPEQCSMEYPKPTNL